jgi:hypothetical protein
MSIQYQFRQEGGVLRVVASGVDDDFDEVTAYGQAVLQAAIEADCDRVLCDERELTYALDAFDTFKSAEMIAMAVPMPGRLAIVCGPDSLPDAEYWETVAVNRGLAVRVYAEVEPALAWLTEPRMA